MKITLIYPAVGKKPGEPYIRTWQMEPLTLATLKALTPPDITVEFFDDRLEQIDYDTVTDLVALTVETYTARRAYAIAARFRARGIPVVMGGPHATLISEEAALYADAILIGNAEDIWPQIIQDARDSTLQTYYYGKTTYHGLPDRTLFRGKRYLPISLVETGRGCPFHCEFCATSAYYKAHYVPRPIADVVADIRQAGRDYVFLIDDNIAAEPTYAMQLCQALAPLRIVWASQATLNVAQHPELLHWLARSGCRMLLIGFESVETANLEQMQKGWLARLGNRDELVRRIHQAGLSIYATFVFGFDHDTPASFTNALIFAQQHGFYFAAFNHLLPFPGTRLYDRLKAEQRLLTEKWWLTPHYQYGTIVFQPATFAPTELAAHCAANRRAFFSLASITRRGLLLARRRPPLKLFTAYWLLNLIMRREVDDKLGLPLGEGLDDGGSRC
jgi:radical SAM superfamily enzyme YgiQ (UPF0313 family)